MKITEAKVIVCGPGRNLVPLKVTTEDGIYGLGDATLNRREAVSFPKKSYFAACWASETKGMAGRGRMPISW